MTCARPVWCSGHGPPVSVPCQANVALPFTPARGTGHHGRASPLCSPGRPKGAGHIPAQGPICVDHRSPCYFRCWQGTRLQVCSRTGGDGEALLGQEARCEAVGVTATLFTLTVYLRWYGRRVMDYGGVAARAPSSLSWRIFMCAQFCLNV